MRKIMMASVAVTGFALMGMSPALASGNNGSNPCNCVQAGSVAYGSAGSQVAGIGAGVYAQSGASSSVGTTTSRFGNGVRTTTSYSDQTAVNKGFAKIGEFQALGQASGFAASFVR